VGALLPIFCTIEDNLSKKDYKEFYNMLSPEAKKSGYGKVLLERSGLE
jgi:hypothetical protein